MFFFRALSFGLLGVAPILALGQEVPAPQPQLQQSKGATIIGTAVDVQHDAIPNAQVELSGPTPADHATAATNDHGFFTFTNLRPAVAYRLTITAKGFANWTSPEITLEAGKQRDLGDLPLQIAVVQTTVTAVSEEQIATQEVHVEEKQRVLGVFPNFYVTYSQNPVPLTTRLKYQLALRSLIDPVTFASTALFAGFDQAGDTPDYQQGAVGYMQRFGAGYADGATSVMIGGAILPSLLHQDPRYYFQGTGSIASRMRHAAAYSVLCKGDNGNWQFNFSGVGGDLASGALSNLYYPPSNRGASIVFENALLAAAGRVAESLAQEFVFQKFTTHPKHH